MFTRRVNNLKWVFIPVLSILFLPSFFWLIGLSSIGPIAGGLFSTMQGAGIISGSFMAMLQSFAMGGWIILIQCSVVIGWVFFSILAFIKKITT